MTKKTDTGKVRVTLLRSLHGQLHMHRNNVRGLGLKRRHQTVEISATAANLGMVNASKFMLHVEEI